MGEEGRVSDVLFLGLVAQLQMQAWVHLGKVMHPATQKAEVDLDAAREAIDILGMLEAKTKGNLTIEENRFVQQTLTTLRLNFVDEAKRQEAEKPKEGPAEPGAADAAASAQAESSAAADAPGTPPAGAPADETTANRPEQAGNDARS